MTLSEIGGEISPTYCLHELIAQLRSAHLSFETLDKMVNACIAVFRIFVGVGMDRQSRHSSISSRISQWSFDNACIPRIQTLPQ